MPLVQNDVVPQDAAARWRLRAQRVLLVLMLINVCLEGGRGREGRVVSMQQVSGCQVVSGEGLRHGAAPAAGVAVMCVPATARVAAWAHLVPQQSPGQTSAVLRCAGPCRRWSASHHPACGHTAAKGWGGGGREGMLVARPTADRPVLPALTASACAGRRSARPRCCRRSCAWHRPGRTRAAPAPSAPAASWVPR